MATYSAAISWPVIAIGSATDAAFRTRISIIEAALSGCGLVQTSDTGQTSSTTATVPASSNQDGGYQIWRFNDSEQGTDPIFLRIVYGSGQLNNGHFRFSLRVGQGTNGAGTLTGQTSGVQICGDEPGSNDFTNHSTNIYACHTNGWFCLLLGPNSGYVSNPNWLLHAVAVMRSKNSSGAFDANGVLIYTIGNNTSINANAASYVQSVRFASPASAGTNTAHYLLCPGLPADTTVAGDKRLYPVWYNIPDIRHAWAFFGVRGNEVGISQTTFTAAPAFGTSRTFLWLGNGYGTGMDASGDTNFQLAFLWE